jgi:hypothetical protein
VNLRIGRSRPGPAGVPPLLRVAVNPAVTGTASDVRCLVCAFHDRLAAMAECHAWLAKAGASLSPASRRHRGNGGGSDVRLAHPRSSGAPNESGTRQSTSRVMPVSLAVKTCVARGIYESFEVKHGRDRTSETVTIAFARKPDPRPRRGHLIS